MCGEGRGDVIGGRHKIYVAFTVEQVVKCNYRGGRHTAEPQPSRQTGRKARRQVIKAYSSTLSLFVPSPFFLYLSVSHWLQTHKSAATSSSSSVKTAEPSDIEVLYGNNVVWAATERPTSRQKDTNRKENSPVTEDKFDILNLTFFLFVTLQEKSSCFV